VIAGIAAFPKEGAPMRRLWALAVGLTLIVGVRAGPDDPPKSPAEELKQLQSQVADARKKMMEIRQQWQEEEDTDKKKKLQEELQKASTESSKLMRENQARAVVIAKADPKSETGLEAAIWGMYSLSSKPVEFQEFIVTMVENNLTSPKISAMASPLTSFIGIRSRPGASDEEMAKAKERSAQALALVETILEKNPDKSVQATVLFGVGESYKNRAEPYGRKPPSDAEELAKKAEIIFERVEKNYADVIQYEKHTFGMAAKAALFELHNLRVGKTAPEVEGEDADGVKFKLSDYRGKVVMLDFWGHW
jgi:hypothetical protein